MSNNYNNVHILLVEDDPGDVKLTQKALQKSKLAVDLTVVMDGEQAMACLFQRPPYEQTPRPDIVLLDLNLPKKDGREVLQEIKGDFILKEIPVVILTTSSAEADILKSYALGANCFITKPVDLNQFIKVVNQIESFWFTVVKLPGRDE